MSKSMLINLRVDEELKKNYQEIVEYSGYDCSKVITAHMKDVVKRGFIPINLYGFLSPKRNNNKITIPFIKKAIQEIISKSSNQNIKKVYLFGSYSRGDESKNSDIDLRIETEDSFSLFDLSSFSIQLKEKTNKEIDIVTGNQLDPHFYDRIKQEEICIYEK